LEFPIAALVIFPWLSFVKNSDKGVNIMDSALLAVKNAFLKKSNKAIKGSA
jgi:hypothetical protein